MKIKFLYIILISLLFSCAGSPYQTGIEAETNRTKMLTLEAGMNKKQVLEIMGQPYKTEMYVINEIPNEFWFYLTKGRSINENTLDDSHFTPFLFKNGILKGWGRNFYDDAIRIKKDITIENK